MTDDKQNLALELLDCINRIVELRVEELVKPLRAELALIKSLQDEWVGTKEALRIIGRTQPQTLKAERERPRTLIVVKFDSPRKPLYLRTSLLAYNDSKTNRPYRSTASAKELRL